jgi:NitT/TauT family transport system substrate-binding protein
MNPTTRTLRTLRTLRTIRTSRTSRTITAAVLLLLCIGCGGRAANEIRIPRGAGGVGFLPLLIMEKHRLIEKHAADAGIGDLTVRWVDLGGPSVVNDALLSGAADYAAAGPPAMLTLWDRTRDSIGVAGVAAMTSLPMYLNTNASHLKTVDDLREGDKIAVTAIKVSIPAIVMQMYAARKYGANEATRFDRYTVSMTHPDAVVAMLSGAAGISAHFASPPFHQRERRDAKIRTIMTSDEVMGGSTTFTMLSTTKKFRAENPDVYNAVLKALDEANSRIAADPKSAAEILLASTPSSGFSVDETIAMLTDPAVKFTTTPENVGKYADFMHQIGSVTQRPGSWKDVFFPEIHSAPGS